MTTLTASQAKRTIDALAETQRHLDRYENRVTFDVHQEAERVKQVDFYRSHILKLQGMLANGWDGGF